MKVSMTLIRNAISNWLAFFLSIVVSLFMMPFLIHYLGVSVYGIWVLIGSLTGYLGLFDFGISGAVVKYVAEFKESRNITDLNEFISTAVIIYSLIGLITLVVCTVIAFYFVQYFRIDAENIALSKWVILIVGVTIATNFPLSVFGGIVRGFQRFDYNSFVEIGMLVLRTILIFYFVARGGGLLALALVTFLVQTAGNCFRIFYVFKLNDQIRIHWALYKRKILKRILNYSIYSFLILMAVRIVYYTDSVVIGLFLSASAITFYSVASRLVEYFRMFIVEMTGVIMPAASELNTHKDLLKVHKLVIYSTKYAFLVTIPLGITLIIMGKVFITLWLGSEFATQAYLILIILTIPQINAMSHGCGSVLFGINKHKVNALSAVGEAVVNLVLSVILVKRIGLKGVALGTAIPLIITSLIIPIYTCRVIGLSFGDYIKKAFVPVLSSGIPFLLANIFFKLYFAQDTWLKFLSQNIACYLLFAIFAWNFSLEKSERATRLQDFAGILGLKKVSYK